MDDKQCTVTVALHCSDLEALCADSHGHRLSAHAMVGKLTAAYPPRRPSLGPGHVEGFRGARKGRVLGPTVCDLGSGRLI